MTAIAGTTFIYPFFPTFNSLISQKPKLTNEEERNALVKLTICLFYSFNQTYH